MTPACYAAAALAITCYLPAAVLYPLRLIRPDHDHTRPARVMLLIGTAVQAMGLLAHAANEGGEGVFGRHANLAFLLVIVMVAALVWLERRTSRPAVAAFLAPVLFLLVIFTIFRPTARVDVVSNPWLLSHVVLATLAEACFGLAFCLAMAYLVEDFFLKRKRLERLPLLPPLPVADNLAHLAVAVGFLLFTLSLGVGGAVYLSAHLPLDDKVILALANWGVYGVYLLVRHTTGWRGRRMQWMIIAGFLIVLVNFLLMRHEPAMLGMPVGVA
ncbi:MAG: cytochrome c biogenesis protein CcsA [Armatimonadetes bacterium]|nr:cytochrome c biogenesis protein CcsA [Armatimonadota bacterium]